MIHQTESESPQPVAEAESLVGVAMHDLCASSKTPETDKRWDDVTNVERELWYLRELSRKLESERDDARIALHAAMRWVHASPIQNANSQAMIERAREIFSPANAERTDRAPEVS